MVTLLVLALAASRGEARVTRPEIKLSDAAARQLFSAADHTYKVHEKVPLYANKVGPFHNPSEVRIGSSRRSGDAPCDGRRRSRGARRDVERMI